MVENEKGMGSKPWRRMQELVPMAKRGNAEALELLCVSVQDTVFGYAYVRTGNFHDAQDLAADCVVKVLEHLPRYKERGAPFHYWVMKIARNQWIDRHKKTKGRTQIGLAHLGELKADRDGIDDLGDPVEMERVKETVKSLPQDQRNVIALRYWKELTVDQIASALGKTKNHVSVLQHRGIEKLRRRLKST